MQILCRGPKANATTVHARHITLYGILKSGVGNETIAPLVLNMAGYPETNEIKCQKTYMQKELKKLHANFKYSHGFDALITESIVLPVRGKLV